MVDILLRILYALLQGFKLSKARVILMSEDAEGDDEGEDEENHYKQEYADSLALLQEKNLLLGVPR